MQANFANSGDTIEVVRPFGEQLRNAIRTLSESVFEDEEFDSYAAQLHAAIEMSGMLTPRYDSITLESWD